MSPRHRRITTVALLTAALLASAVAALLSGATLASGVLVLATMLQAVAWRVLLRHEVGEAAGTDVESTPRVEDLPPAPAGPRGHSPAPLPLNLALAGQPTESLSTSDDLLIDLAAREPEAASR